MLINRVIPCLLLKNSNNEIIGTYAARNLDPIIFLGNLRNHFNLTNYLENPDDYLPGGQSFASTINCFYSGNQWVKSTYQNTKCLFSINKYVKSS
jgi:hypothetical protein